MTDRAKPETTDRAKPETTDAAKPETTDAAKAETTASAKGHAADGAAELAGVIGGRVRRERQARRWTLDRLAESAGVSRRMLVNVEQGEANPSVATLLRISDALGIGLPALVEPPRAKPVRLTRCGEGAVLWRGEHGGRGILVAGTRPPDVLELWDWTLQVGERHESEAHSAGTKELIEVLTGTVEVASGGVSSELGPGDAISFPGDAPHRYRNAGTEPARFALAVFEPGVGSQTTSGGNP